MAGLTHSNDTTGKDKKANGFRHFFNSYMSGAALAPVLPRIRQRPQGLSPDRRLQLGLHHRAGDPRSTPKPRLGNRDRGAHPADPDRLLSYIAPVLNSGADVLVLNHYGGDMVNSLTNAVQFGLRDKLMANGKKFEIVVPLYSV
jgi:branched-chain amino acid transport system substrate-binding protein